jgi:hypothetical protein
MRLLFLLFILSAGVTVQATNYYFSTTNGNDARSAAEASNPSTPWKSLAKLNSIFSTLNPGDVVYFQRGDYFEGSITVTRSGTSAAPITFSAYGSGSNPVITGFSTLGGWVSTGNGIWETSVPGSQMVNQVLFNNELKALGRYPNSDAANSGYLMHEAVVSRTQITDNELPASPNYTGAEVVIRKSRWVLDRDLVTNHSGTTIQYSTGTASITPFKNYGYFFQNHPATLDLVGEWYFKTSTRKLGMYFGSANPSQSKVVASTVNVLVFIENQHYINFENLSFHGGNQKTIQIINSQNISISNCEIFYSGMNAIDANIAPNLMIERNVINYSNNLAIHVNCTNSIIRSNKISHTGSLRGMGQPGNHSYQGMMVFGDGNLVELNEILHSGYMGIYFDGNNVTIKNNFINYFGIHKDDGGGIYTNGGSNATARSNRKIINNIILNGIGTGEGSDQPLNLQASGIYLDDNSSNLQITGNTVANCSQAGIYIHNSNTQNVDYNTFYNNGTQVCINSDQLNSVHRIHNLNIQENILFSSNGSRRLADYLSVGNEIPNFGVINNNYYARPANDNAIIKTVYNNGTYNSKITDLEGWKPLFSKDVNSKKSPWQLAPYRLVSLSGINKFSNGTFNSTIAGVDHYSPQGNSVISWSNNGKLDGGALQVSFSSHTGSDKRNSITLNIGAVTAYKNYILTFSVVGTDENKTVETFLRKIGSPYTFLTIKSLSKVTGSRTNYELLFTPTISEASACLVFNVLEQTSPLWFDNVKLMEAEVMITKPEDSIRFEYNASSSSKTIQLDGAYVDAKNISYTTSINLGPYTSAVLIRKTGATGLPPNPTVNQVPVSNAGADFSITLPSNATLNGTASKDVDGSIIKYEWKQVSGPSNATFQSANAATTTVTNLLKGSYTFELWIWDDKYMPASDQVVVTVNASSITTDPAINQAPDANAGNDASITLPVNSMTLNASGSSDADGSIIKYEWKQVSGPSTAIITSVNAVNSSVQNLVQGTYIFALWIWDNKYMPASDQVTITVKPAAVVVNPSVNLEPLARAGSDATVTLPLNTYSLNGAASADPDGSIIKFEWKQVSGPSTASIALPNSAITTIGNLQQGKYIFKLWIWDNQYMPAADEVTITVLAAPVQVPGVNQLPVAKAGADITVAGSSATINGSASYDSDGSIIKYLWTKESGPTQFAIANANAATTTVSNLVLGTYIFRLTIWDNKYEPSFDRVVITVVAAATAVVPANLAPIAKAGNDISLTLPSNSININGSGTYDPDGSIIKYEWIYVSGPSQFNISNINISNPTINNLVAGTYVFRLTVWDNKYEPSSDQLMITVLPATTVSNILPVSNAGSDISVAWPGNSTMLNGTGSYDADGNIIKYEWRKESGPAATIVSVNGASTAISGLVPGTYVFRLTIWDNKYQPAFDKVTVTVGSGSGSANAMMITPMEELSIIEQPLQAYPNPVINTVNLRMVNDDLGKVQMNIYDLSGKMVQSALYQKSAHIFQQQLQVSTLIKGVYFVELITAGTKKSVTKFVKQ